MPKSTDEVVDILLEIYAANFAGKEGTRYRIQCSELTKLWGLRKMNHARFQELAEVAERKDLYLLDLGEGVGGHPIAVVSCGTVDRWRLVPKKVIETYVDKKLTQNEEENDDE